MNIPVYYARRVTKIFLKILLYIVIWFAVSPLETLCIQHNRGISTFQTIKQYYNATGQFIHAKPLNLTMPVVSIYNNYVLSEPLSLRGITQILQKQFFFHLRQGWGHDQPISPRQCRTPPVHDCTMSIILIL